MTRRRAAPGADERDRRGGARLLRRGAGGGEPEGREQAVRSAEADLKRAETVRAAGMSTDADVLSIRVHLAAVTEQRSTGPPTWTWPRRL